MKPYNGFSGEQREAAAKWIREGIAAGKIAAPARCFCCDQTAGPIHYHCEDYGEPFGPQTIRYPLCWLCHMVWHCRFRHRAAAKRYIERVGHGFRGDPIRGGFPELDRLMTGMFDDLRGQLNVHTRGPGPWHVMNTEAASITGKDFLHGQ